MRYLSSRENGWQVVDCEGDNLHGQNHIELAIADAVDALRNGHEPLLSGHNAIRATEVIFATYESSRRGGRVDLPLDISDSPLQARLDEAGISL